MSNPGAAKVAKCLAVVRTPLQLINASEYIYEHGIDDAVLIVIRNCRKWDLSGFEAVPSMALWREVTEFHWSSNLFNRVGSRPSLKILGDMMDDIRFKRFFRLISKEWNEVGTLIIGNTNDLWLRHIANNYSCSVLVECEDGAASLNSNWMPTKSWLLRKVVSGFHAEAPRLSEIYTTYDGIESSGAIVKKNNYDYIASLFEEGKVQAGEDVWFVGQPLVELTLMSRNAYIRAVSAVKDRYVGIGRFLYCPHPSERSVNVEHLCKLLGIDRVYQKSILEISILTADKTPARIASFYSSAISTVLGIFNGRIGVDVYRPDVSLFTEKMVANTYESVFGWFEKAVTEPNRFYRISSNDYSIY